MDLRDHRAEWPDGLGLLFVHQGAPADGEAFFGKRWPEAAATSDIRGLLAQGFGLDRGSLSQLFGPAVWKRGLQAWRAGHRVGRPAGDVRLMPGAFLVDGDDVLWARRGRHAGDHVGWEVLRPVLERLREGSLAGPGPSPA